MGMSGDRCGCSVRTSHTLDLQSPLGYSELEHICLGCDLAQISRSEPVVRQNAVRHDPIRISNILSRDKPDLESSLAKSNNVT